MNWDAVIERNREALKRILAMLVGMAGLAGEDKTLPRHLHRTILRLLRPAEAAARRLVIVVARELAATPQARKEENSALPRPRKPRPGPVSIFVRNGKGTGIVLPHGVKPGDILPSLAGQRKPQHSLALPLFDTLRGLPRRPRAAATGVPRIWTPGSPEPYRGRRPPLPGDAIDATRLALRLQAIGRALDDLPGHAKRFARWRAHRDAAAARIGQELGAAGVQLDQNLYGAGARNRSRAAAGAQNRKDGARRLRIDPLRPGRPPGSCRRSGHEVHEVLKDLQYFAQEALEQFQQKCEAVLRPELRKNEKEERPDTS